MTRPLTWIREASLVFLFSRACRHTICSLHHHHHSCSANFLRSFKPVQPIYRSTDRLFLPAHFTPSKSIIGKPHTLSAITLLTTDIFLEHSTHCNAVIAWKHHGSEIE
jgi:hypothetical protein